MSMNGMAELYFPMVKPVYRLNIYSLYPPRNFSPPAMVLTRFAHRVQRVPFKYWWAIRNFSNRKDLAHQSNGSLFLAY